MRSTNVVWSFRPTPGRRAARTLLRSDHQAVCKEIASSSEGEKYAVPLRAYQRTKLEKIRVGLDWFEQVIHKQIDRPLPAEMSKYLAKIDPDRLERHDATLQEMRKLSDRASDQLKGLHDHIVDLEVDLHQHLDSSVARFKDEVKEMTTAEKKEKLNRMRSEESAAFSRLELRVKRVCEASQNLPYTMNATSRRETAPRAVYNKSRARPDKGDTAGLYHNELHWKPLNLDSKPATTRAPTKGEQSEGVTGSRALSFRKVHPVGATSPGFR